MRRIWPGVLLLAAVPSLMADDRPKDQPPARGVALPEMPPR